MGVCIFGARSLSGGGGGGLVRYGVGIRYPEGRYGGEVSTPMGKVAMANETHTLGPAYCEFGYYEHPAKMNRFCSLKPRLLIGINVQKVRIQRVSVITSTLLWIKLLVVSGTQCTVGKRAVHILLEC